MNGKLARVAIAVTAAASVAVLASCGGPNEDGPGIVTPPPPVTRTVSVVGGAGTGRVTSSAGGIDCRIANGIASGTCSATLNDGASVTLTAAPDADQLFKAWSGDCTGATTCPLTMTKNMSASAGFVGKFATIALSYQTPTTDDGAALIAITGPAISSITPGAGIQIAQRLRASDSKTILMVRGNLTAGGLATLSISGLDADKTFSATVDQVAARQSGSYAQRANLANYAVTIR